MPSLPVNPDPDVDPDPRASLQSAIEFYDNAAKSSALFSSVPSVSQSSTPSALLSVIPFRHIIFHVLWSALVSYLVTRSSTENFRFSPPPLVTSAAGTSLFILLAFIVSDATSRYRAALEHLHQLHVALRHLLRKLHLSYPRNTWHNFDHERILAHIAAIPIALALHLRKLRASPPLEPLLHADDISDILKAPAPHLHCSMLVRAYFACAEDDSAYNFPAIVANQSPAGLGVRNLHVTLLDAVDAVASCAQRIATARVAQGYLTHIRIFLAVWLALVPLALAPTTRWFTPLWTGLIAHSVTTVFEAAAAMQTPFSNTRISVPLERISASITAALLRYALHPPSLAACVKTRTGDHTWLDAPLPHNIAGYGTCKGRPKFAALRDVLHLLFRPRLSVLLSMLAFSIWTAISVFATCNSNKSHSSGANLPTLPSSVCMALNIPISFRALALFSTAVFLLLSFWLRDGYARFARALYLWRVRARPAMERIAHAVALLAGEGLWHAGDRRRFLSHLAALPVAMKQHLRRRPDMKDLVALVGEADAHELTAPGESTSPTRCADVLNAYIDSADAANGEICSGLEDVGGCESPFRISRFFLQGALWDAEQALWECEALRDAPTAPAFTFHLKAFVAIWLLLLPLVVVQNSGWLAVSFVLPIAYAVINVVQVADALGDPFRFERERNGEGIPLDLLCNEIRDSIHRICKEARDGTRGVVLSPESAYDRQSFEPGMFARKSERADSSTNRSSGAYRAREVSEGPWHEKTKQKWGSLFETIETDSKLSIDGRLPTVRDHEEHLSLLKSMRRRLARFPAISLSSYVAVTLWSVGAVILSRTLSNLWGDAGGEKCPMWCSPLDVDPSMLSNLGFALFLLISMRVTDAVRRYDAGASLMFELAQRMRQLTLFMTQVFPDGFFHSGDKERFIAHLTHIPICLRDVLRGERQGRLSVEESLLSAYDKQRFVESSSPVEYLLETVEAFMLLQESPTRTGWDIGSWNVPLNVAGPIATHLSALRGLIAEASTINRFAILVTALRRQERLFATMWLGILPLTLTSKLGYYTIAWSPLISYGVLALQDTAGQLADPFGWDKGDLPMDGLAARAADGVLDALFSTGWNTTRHCEPPSSVAVVSSSRGLGAMLHNGRVNAASLPPVLAGAKSEYDCMGSDNFEHAPFFERAPPRAGASLYAHLRKSTPWKGLAGILCWALFASVLRLSSDNLGWVGVEMWKSVTFSSICVLNGVSFGAFMLLSFFAAIAAERYENGARIWEGGMRAHCHALASAILNVTESGSVVHEGGKRRLLGLVAAMPLLLKQELRGTRDLRDVSALLCKEDLSRVACADGMVTYCADVVRTHVMRMLAEPMKQVEKETAPPGPRGFYVTSALQGVERAVRDARMLRLVDVSPTFKTLLGSLLTILLAILPFILFEVSGEQARAVLRRRGNNEKQ